MSTAIMSQNALYEFGENFVNKNGAPNSPDSSPNLAVGSAAMRLTLTRMVSTPCGATTTNQQNLAAMLLSNINSLNISAAAPQHRRLERTQSAPAPPVTVPVVPVGAVPATTVNGSRYKTELCRPFQEFGVCKYGDKCQFAHGINEVRNLARHPKYKTELCRTFHTVGFCPYGPRCHFVHNQDEIIQQKSVSPSATNQIPILSRANSITAPIRSRPAALSPSLSVDSAGSQCSLSQSPTSSISSFFNSEPELHSPGPFDDQRLPVFNRLLPAFSGLL